MSTVGQKERATQNRVIKLFQNSLGYQYLGNWEERFGNRNIEEEYLRPFLKRQGYSETLIGKAVYELKKVAEDQSSALSNFMRPFPPQEELPQEKGRAVLVL